MLPATSPAALIAHGRRLQAAGQLGLLISGGCDPAGRLPWQAYYDAIATIKATTGLYISVHSGLITPEQARQLKAAGVDQALIDVIGDDATFQRIYHLDQGLTRLHAALKALQQAELPIVPHIVCGLNYGRIIAEKKAVALLRDYNPAQIAIVVLMKLKGVPTNQAEPPAAEAVADVIAEARLNHPAVPISLGCARPRGDTHLEFLALEAGVTRMALASPETVARAQSMGLEIHYQDTCCSVAHDIPAAPWEL